jgi:hypothetical protein
MELSSTAPVKWSPRAGGARSGGEQPVRTPEVTSVGTICHRFRTMLPSFPRHPGRHRSGISATCPVEGTLT